KKWVQEIFLRLKERGYIYEATMTSPYCPTDQRFLPDRYVEGTCPHCGFPAARGDQCENCGKLLDPFEMKDPKCRIDGSTPVPRETKHFFFKLTALQPALERWLASGKDHWRTHVLGFSRGFLAEGLKDRPITRDLQWGIEVPVPGYETKRIYVWFEAVMGYLTATRESSRRNGREDEWRDWWRDPAARHYYFIGPDNIVFHSIIWPAILMAYDEAFTLPYDVPATHFLNVSGERMSAGRGRGAWLPEMLERFSPDQIRYYVTSTMPETKDTEFSWQDFAQRNNAELLAVYGNFVHRALTFAAKNFGNAVSAAGLLDGADKTMIRNIEEQWRKVGQNLEFLHFRDALREAIQLARLGNQYFDQKAPWDLIRRDRVACGTAIHVALRVSRALALLMAPFTPFSSRSLWHALGYEDDVHAQSWDSVVDDIPANQSLRVGKPLFEKIEIEAASEDERFDVRVGQITDVQDHPNADQLYVIQVNMGDETRTLVAGMKANYAKEQMKGKRVAVLCNLEPAKLRGVQSNGMVLAAEDEHDVGL
ncbi:MAG: methionine--tRNA ligase, partial [Candidatus Thermoplasmatota archaeon]